MLRKRSFSLAGHRTSVALEPAFWAALERAAGQAGIGLAALVAGVDRDRAPGHALASALRLHALEHGAHDQYRSCAQGRSPETRVSRPSQTKP